MLRFHALCAGIRGRISAMRQDQRGVAAVEFAMMLPVMLILYLGGVETSQGLGIERKVVLTARSVADLVAQTSNNRELTPTGFASRMSNAEMETVMNAAMAVIAPYPRKDLKVRVSSVYINTEKEARIDWSRAHNTLAWKRGEKIPLPEALAVPGTYLVWAEVDYDYTPIIGYVITGTLVLNHELHMMPRHTDRICVDKCLVN